MIRWLKALSTLLKAGCYLIVVFSPSSDILKAKELIFNDSYKK